MNMTRVFGALLAFVLAVALVPCAMAADYTVDKVKINGFELGIGTMSVSAGNTLRLDVTIADTNLSSPRDIKIKAILFGGENEDIKDESELVTLHPGVTALTRTLFLELPSDMDTGIHTLKVSAEDRVDSVVSTFSLLVEKERHFVDILGININPSNTVNAGQLLEVNARLKNEGLKTEEIKIIFEIPSLSITKRQTWVELESGETATTDEVEILIPKTASGGEHEVIITAYYSDGRKFSEVKETITVVPLKQETVVVENEDDGEEAVYVDDAQPVEKEVLVSMDSTSQVIANGKEVAFKVSIASFDSLSRVLNFKVSGAQLFADVRVDPSFIELQGGQKAEAYVYVTMHDDAEAGAHTMMLQVTSDGKLLREIQMTAVSKGPKESMFSALDDSTLKIVFVVMVVMLIIIGLLVAFKRVRSDDFPLEPREDRTYY